MNYSLYFNGWYKSVLDEIISSQINNPGITCYLQPAQSKYYRKLKSDPPSDERPILAYFSTTKDLSNVSYKGFIVGWEDKQQISEKRLEQFKDHINNFQPGEKGRFIEDVKAVNLLSIKDLIKIQKPFHVNNLTKLSDNTSVKVRTTTGGHSYVNKLPSDFVSVKTDVFTPINFRQGKRYLRKNIIDKYGGQSRSGITTPSKHPVIFLITSDKGEEFGYTDGWTDNGSFEICGEGQVGDMKYVRGNKAILEHRQNGKELHLFEKIENRYVRYISKMVYKSHREDIGPDINGNDRKRIIFELIPEDTLFEGDAEFTSTETKEGKKVLRYSTVYERDPKARSEALAIHGYDCMACGLNFGKFYGVHGEGFIHVHHIKPLSESGETKVDPKTDLIPLCPNCHAMVHKKKTHTLSLEELKQLLK